MLVDVGRMFRETLGARYYRRRPREAARYAAAKSEFARHRVSTDELLAGLGFDPLAARSDLDEWAKPLGAAIESVDAAAEEFNQGHVSLDGALLLYGVIRSLRPEVVVETGVASGISSSFIGAAMLANGTGRLVSIDLPPRPIVLDDGGEYDWTERGVAWAMPDEIRDELGSRFELVLEDVRTSLPRIVDEFGTIDVFVHDDLHTPDHMRWEFDLVWPALRPGGVVLCDDVNHGWLDFAASVGRREQATANVRRFSAIRKPTDPAP